MNIKTLPKIIWLLIFSLTHPATIGLLIFCLGKKLDITSSSRTITLLNAQEYFCYGILFTIIWYSALYFISSITKNTFSKLLDYNLGIKVYPIYTKLLQATGALLFLIILLVPQIFTILYCLLQKLLSLKNIDIIFFIFLMMFLSYCIHIYILHIIFAIYGYITLKTFSIGMEGNVFVFAFALPLLLFLMQSFALFIQQLWMLITKQFSPKIHEFKFKFINTSYKTFLTKILWITKIIIIFILFFSYIFK